MKNNRKGIAILMVISSIAILAYLLVDFTFETNIHKLKAYNYQESAQARLNAESGIALALVKLQGYSKIINVIEKRRLQGVISPLLINEIITKPFIYPIPNLPNINTIQKNIIDEFNESTILPGQLILNIKKISGFLNPNSLRILIKPQKKSKITSKSNNEDEEQDIKEINIHQEIEKKMTELLTNKLNEIKENRDDFELIFKNPEPEQLIKELKYYVNNPTILPESEKAIVDNLYQKRNITPKHAPMTMIDELYLLEGWNDAIVDLMKPYLSIHEVSFISVNDLTSEQLKIVFPQISDEQLEQFFKYRDGDPENNEPPSPFGNINEFKNFIIAKLALIGEESYKERINELESVGLRIGVIGKLYEVTSIGVFNRSRYKIIAIVDMPIKKIEQTTKKSSKSSPNQKIKPPLELLRPRIIQITTL